MAHTPTERWRLVAQGQVQGVGYRVACCRTAVALGLGGWVRNCSDGSVEIEAEGLPRQLGELRMWCEQGPQEARVSRVVTSRIPITGEDWFEVRS
jgi:acylphosphatase